ncbi:hypothetical protein CAEBREN_11699 [Caenorhabditis brenneri]|uniref:G protein-coupled receptor n=1 Tax=Caenorhabditis brenneri TaxID=135651 RepID=G0MW43_CAEBE|nr:hypothetical protein CAEBREN_11699 [Caenorhabditis brenneri]
MSLAFLLVYVGNRSDYGELLKVLVDIHPEYHYDDASIWGNLTLTGHISMLSPITFISIFYMAVPCAPIYCAILWFRHKTLFALNHPSVYLSTNTRANHKKLVRALTVQAAIPIFWLVTSGLYILAQFGLIGGPIFENITFRLLDCIPMVSPIATILFIQPYKEGFVNMFYRVYGVANSSATMPTHYRNTVTEASSRLTLL